MNLLEEEARTGVATMAMLEPERLEFTFSRWITD
jgi:hypothetical protein